MRARNQFCAHRLFPSCRGIANIHEPQNTLQKYFPATSQKGSKKAASYVRASDMLNEVIQVVPFSFANYKNIWVVSSVERLQELYLFVLMEAREGDGSAWNIEGIPTSYLQNGYSSAALKSYQEFLIGYGYEQELLTVFNEHKGDESAVVEKLDRKINYPQFLLDGWEISKTKKLCALYELVAIRMYFGL